MFSGLTVLKRGLGAKLHQEYNMRRRLSALRDDENRNAN